MSFFPFAKRLVSSRSPRGRRFLELESLENRCLLSTGIIEYPTPTRQSAPSDLTAGPDGNIWFTEGSLDVNKIGRITPAGTVTEFQLPGTPDPNLPPTLLAAPDGITTGPDGNLWFTEKQIVSPPGGVSTTTGFVGRITPTGSVTEFQVPDTDIFSITAGADGNLWYEASSAIGRVTPAGVVTRFALSTADAGDGVITGGPDGNVWFTEKLGTTIGRITPQGAITEFPLSKEQAGGIVTGPDGNLWLTTNDAIGRMTPAGALTLFPLPNGHSGAAGITVGADGNLWFSELALNFLKFTNAYIGKITPTGTITEYLVPTENDAMGSIASGADGNIWFVEVAPSKIGRVVLNAPDLTPAAALTVAPDNTFTGPVATFTAPQNNAPASAYTATIDWGDGSSSSGAVSGSGQFVVTGSHTFAGGGGFGGSLPFSVTLHGPDGVSTEVMASAVTILPNASFVEHLYHDLLQREADPGGLADWTARMAQGMTRAQVVQGFEGSLEYRTDVVEHLYQTLLGRTADTTGLSGFVDFLAQGGSADAVEATILGSGEYLQRAGGNQDGFLTALYHDVLGRAVDAVGQAAWSQLLMLGFSRQQIAAAVLGSVEAERDQIGNLYRQLLHRPADDSGMSFFLASLQQGARTEDVLTAIAGSDEYFAKASPPPVVPPRQ